MYETCATSWGSAAQSCVVLAGNPVVNLRSAGVASSMQLYHHIDPSVRSRARTCRARPDPFTGKALQSRAFL